MLEEAQIRELLILTLFFILGQTSVFRGRTDMFAKTMRIIYINTNISLRTSVLLSFIMNGARICFCIYLVHFRSTFLSALLLLVGII